VLVKPGEHVEGSFNKGQFYPYDSNTVNFKLRRISGGFTAILDNYPPGSNFENFKKVFASLQKYVDSTDNELNKNIRPWQDSRVELALKEYLQTRLAHFLVLPVLFKNNYDEQELMSIIRQSINIKFPEYWLQIESGRIFLHTYFRKIVLPDSKFNLQKALSGKWYAIAGFRNLATYDYFRECLEAGIVRTKTQLLADYKQTTAKLQLSKKEQDVMKEDIYKPLQQIGKDISDLFVTLPLQNSSGELLTDEEKKSLIAGGNILLDFWASWCMPCRQKMEKHSSDIATIGHKQYHIIYLSIDEDVANWQSVTYRFLKKSNSFRITVPGNEFVKHFEIRVIPRYILLSNAGLISADFAF